MLVTPPLSWMCALLPVSRCIGLSVMAVTSKTSQCSTSRGIFKHPITSAMALARGAGQGPSEGFDFVQCSERQANLRAPQPAAESL